MFQHDPLRESEGPSALPMSSRLMRAKLPKFSSSASIRSQALQAEVSAAPRSQIFSETDQPERRILESRSAS